MANEEEKSPAYFKDEDSLDTSVVSSNECTGMTPSLPIDQDEVESYQDIYAVPLERGGKDQHEKL